MQENMQNEMFEENAIYEEVCYWTTKEDTSLILILETLGAWKEPYAPCQQASKDESTQENRIWCSKNKKKQNQSKDERRPGCMEYAQWESYALPSCKGAYVGNLDLIFS